MPGHGHFFPYVPLARALASAGHHVTFATSKSYATVVEEHGFDTLVVGIDYTQGSVPVEGDESLDAVEQLMFVENPPQILEDLLPHLETSPPDVLLADPTETGSMVAAEAAGVPWGSVVNGRRNGFYPGFVPFAKSERPGSPLHLFQTGLARLRESAGLEPVDYLSGELPYDRTFSLCMAPPSFNGWPLTVQHHTSHPLRPQIHTSDSEDDWLHDLPDEPLVAISLGTLWGTPALYETAARAALETGARVVVATGLDVDVEHERLTKVAWVSMDNLMARADVLVHHGGWGSTVAALASGTASVVIPMGADQFWNAQGIANTGAGVVAQKTDAAETLQALFEESLGNPLYRLNAERLRSEIDAMPAPAEVVPLIERLAEDEVVFNKEAS